MAQSNATEGTSASAKRTSAQRTLTLAGCVGQRASEAVQELRRAGLKPALERSFGCEPERIGEVIAQEPVAGSQLARNSMVTLYVGAPGDEQPAERGEEAAGAARVVAPDLSLAGDRRRPTRRKPGLAASTARPTEPPPAPERVLQSDAPTEKFALDDAPGAEQLLERAEALFAEGRGAWRLRTRLAALSWGQRWRPGRAARRWGAVVVTLLLAVGLASAIGSRSGAARSAISGVHKSAAAPTSRERVAEAGRKPQSLGSTRRERRGTCRRSPHAARGKRRHTQAARAQSPAAQRLPPTRALPASSTPPPAARPESEFSP
jgi:hypothetical protein